MLPSAYTAKEHSEHSLLTSRPEKNKNISNSNKYYIPLGWNILETNRTVGGLFGYSSVNSMVSLKVPGIREIVLNEMIKKTRYNKKTFKTVPINRNSIFTSNG